MKRLFPYKYLKKESQVLFKAESKTNNQKQKIDFILLGVILILSLFGLLMVYDVSQFEAFQTMGDKYYFFKQQTMWFGLGFLSLAFFSFFDYRKLKLFATPFFLLSVVLLLLVFVPGLGVSAGGAHRWLKIAFIPIQPAEIVKLSTIIFLSALFEKKVSSKTFLLVVGIVATIIGLFQKDLGTAIVFSLISFGLYFTSGAPIRYFLSFLSIGIVTFIGFIFTSSYRRQRVLAFLDPFADPQGFSYHISQILIALGSGGFLGVGIGGSRQKFAYIPEVSTDSIFSIIGEEFGFLGGAILIGVFTLLIIRGFKIAERTKDLFGRYLALGLTIWLGSQAILNLAAMVSIVPLTGVPLPFISYGGSALLANLTAIGILLNISRQN